MKIELNVGDVMTIDEFADAVESGGLIDYDGSGQWLDKAYEVLRSEGVVIPSKFSRSTIPLRAKYIVWYNR